MTQLTWLMPSLMWCPISRGDESLTLRGGRFGMSLGSGRLVATRAAPSAPNIPFRFDGFEMLYAAPSWEATAFLTRPAKDSGHIDGSDPNTTFWGLYLTHWLDAPRQVGLDLYYLGIVNNPATYASGTADEDRQSFGLRFFGRRNRWEWNLENTLRRLAPLGINRKRQAGRVGGLAQPSLKARGQR